MFRKIAANELARLLGVLAHPERIRIIEELSSKELDVSELQSCLELSQPSVSRHLGIMKANRIVAERKEGRRVYYHLSVPLLARWLVEGLDIIVEREKTELPMATAFAFAKERWQKDPASHDPSKAKVNRP
jgi:DNA-binding transcriptional ArsR family regulator